MTKTPAHTTLEIGAEFKIPKGQKYGGRWAKVFAIRDGIAAVELRNGQQLGASAGLVRSIIETASGVVGEVTTVYRIEHAIDGRGCYNRDDEPEDKGMGSIVGSTIADNRHPTIALDSKLLRSVGSLGVDRFDLMMGNTPQLHPYVFGFSSPEQLRSWMYRDEWLEKLSDQHYILAVCEVRVADVLEGNAQCMFIRPKVYEKKNLREYFNL